MKLSTFPAWLATEFGENSNSSALDFTFVGDRFDGLLASLQGDRGSQRPLFSPFSLEDLQQVVNLISAFAPGLPSAANFLSSSPTFPAKWVLSSAPTNFPVASKPESPLPLKPDDTSASPDRPAGPEARSLSVPADPLYASQWGLTAINALAGWSVLAANLVDPEPIVVAVIDTGIDYTHADLAANMWTNWQEVNGTPGIDDDGNGYLDDVYGYDFAYGDADPFDGNYHGTHVAGIIGAVDNNQAGITGVASAAGVELMALKALGDNGTGSTQAIANAIIYAVDNGAQIINLSLGSPTSSWAMQSALAYADARDVLVVAAAGNSGSNSDVQPLFPAAFGFDNVISVAATTVNDTLASFSNYGATSVDLGAPGANILSTVPGGGYAFLSGTSMATPLVAGAAAVLMATLPETVTDKADAVKALLLETTRDSAALLGKTVSGGILDLEAAALQAITVSQVQAVNMAPVAMADAYTLLEDTILSFAVLANDIDAEGDALVITAFSAPQYGTLQLSQTGIFTYSPAANYAGTDRFTYTIDDGQGGTATATVTLTITPINDAPTAEADQILTPISTTTTILASDLLGNDTDPDGDRLTLVEVGNAIGGTVQLGSDGNAIFTPTAQYEGPGSFTYTVTDGSGALATATVQLDILAPRSASAFSTDFEANLPDLEISNGIVSTQFGGSGASLFFTGGLAGEPARYVLTPMLDLRQGATITFDLIFGNSLNGGENADAGEDVSLDYSVDGGQTWTRLALYDTEAFTTWTTLTEVLPIAAQSQTAQLRWSQIRSSGRNYDNWGLDNIAIAAEAAVTGEDTLAPAASQIFKENFVADLDPNQWQAVGNGAINGNFTGRDRAFFFTGGSYQDDSRFLTTTGVNVESGGTLQFDLIFGDSLNGGENADWGEDVALDYSLDGGQTWAQMALYDTEAFTSWTTITETIPVGAQSDETRFRWSQVSHSGFDYDNWAIADISIVV